MELEITMLNAINPTLKDKHHTLSFIVTASILCFTSIQGSIGHGSRKVTMKAERGWGEKRVTEHMLCDSRGKNLGDEGD